MRVRVAILLTLAVALSACGGATATPGPTTVARTFAAQTPRPTPTPVPVPPSPTGEAPPTPVPCAASIVASCVVGGDYTDPTFVPTLTLTADPPWERQQSLGDSFVVFWIPDPRIDLGFFSSELVGSDNTPIEAGADAFLEYLEGLETVEVSGRGEATIGGVDAEYVDVTALEIVPQLYAGGAPEDPAEDRPAYYLDAGAVARFYALEVGGRTVVLSLEGGDIERAAQVAQPILDSVSWGVEG